MRGARSTSTGGYGVLRPPRIPVIRHRSAFAALLKHNSCGGLLDASRFLHPIRLRLSTPQVLSPTEPGLKPKWGERPAWTSRDRVETTSPRVSHVKTRSIALCHSGMDIRKSTWRLRFDFSAVPLSPNRKNLGSIRCKPTPSRTPKYSLPPMHCGGGLPSHCAEYPSVQKHPPQRQMRRFFTSGFVRSLCRSMGRQR
jgi:hypothetical protein